MFFESILFDEKYGFLIQCFTYTLLFQHVSVTPLNEDPSRGCSAEAVVASKASSWGSKAQSIVTAEDASAPGHLLR